MLLEAGSIVEGKITGITQFGAFVSLEDGKTGLVHISEVALEYVKDINDHIKVGDQVKVKVLTIDQKGKISLSIKQALLAERKNAPRPPRPKRLDTIDFSKKTSSAPQSFEEMMNRFKQDSDEKMQDLKRGLESKRGSGSYRRSSGSF